MSHLMQIVEETQMPKTPECHHPDFAWCPKCHPQDWQDRAIPAEHR